MNTYLNYIVELRKRLLTIAGAWGLVFLFYLSISNRCYNYIAVPILQSSHLKLVSINITGGFVAPLQLSMTLSWITTIPFIIYQIWAFVAPALLKLEKKIVLNLTIFSISLFYVGMIFGFKVICPIALNFFVATVPDNIDFLPDISSYLHFITNLTIAGGIAFQTPIITVMLARMKFIGSENINDIRRIVLLCSFIFGMLLTPPDVVSQILLAIPIYGLFEFGLIINKLLVTRAKQLS